MRPSLGDQERLEDRWQGLSNEVDDLDRVYAELETLSVRLDEAGQAEARDLVCATMTQIEQRRREAARELDDMPAW
jgi:hypothetical protein